MFDDDEKIDSAESDVIEIEEEPTNPEQKADNLQEDLVHLKRRVAALEDDMRIVKEKLKKMSFSPGL